MNSKVSEPLLFKENQLGRRNDFIVGVAHNLNNSLAIMLGNITLCRNSGRKDDNLSSRLDSMERSIMQAKYLTDQLMVYAKEGLSINKEYSMDELVASNPVAVHKNLVHENINKQEIYNSQGKILVLDDEEPMRTITGEMLVKLGYDSDLVCDGDEAIELYKKSKTSSYPYRAVLVELSVSGGTNGETTVKKLLAIDPKARIIISSAYVNKDIIGEYPRTGFINKPYNLKELFEVLQEVINYN